MCSFYLLLVCRIFWTASRTMEEVMRRIQSWVFILQQPKLQPMHGKSSILRTLWMSPIGIHRCLFVGPMMEIVGMPIPTAMCNGPELLQMKTEQQESKTANRLLSSSTCVSTSWLTIELIFLAKTSSPGPQKIIRYNFLSFCNQPQ